MENLLWIPLDRLTVGDCHSTPKSGYVYFLRNRVGKDILYIGQTGNIQKRIFGNYLGGIGGATTKRIHELLFKKDWIHAVEFSYIETADHISKEKELIKQHKPAWNLK